MVGRLTGKANCGSTHAGRATVSTKRVAHLVKVGGEQPRLRPVRFDGELQIRLLAHEPRSLPRQQK